MRKTILFLLFLCAHWVAQGQMPYEYRYWFDGDESGQRTGTSATPQWSMALDLDGLSQSFHSLHFQVKDTVWSSPVTRYFLKVPEEGPKTFTYWFDNGYREAATATVTDGTAVLDVSQLTDGMHFMHIAYDMDGQNSLPKTAVFWKQPLEGQLRYRLWMDNDPGTQQSGDYNGQPIELDVSAMDDGFHILHAQIEGRGTASIPYTQMFIKVPQTVGVDYLTCLFMVDSEVYKQERVPAEGGAVHWEFDATRIPQGLHKAQGLIVTPSGVASNVQEAFFYRTMTTTEKAAMQCYYSIDGDTHRHQAGKLTGDLFHFDLDVSELSDGFHRLSYMLMDPNGASSKVMSAFFIKTPLGGNGITQYTYWLNDNEENMHSVQLEERTNPFKLITLLPVEACPIRSSCFCFEVEDGQPMVYARNDLHVRFYDVAGRITEASERYVDYNVGEEVTDVVALADSEGKVSEDRPEENGILWYSMDAVIGDSLSVKSNRACTLQIFAPDGEEVYAASGAESVAFGGCHAYKDGTYYIALHDVTATGGTDVELSYQHIDKYAVLEYDVHTTGNGGYTTITFQGNGFNSLFTIDLINGNDTVRSVDINHIADYQVEAMFDFKGVKIGTYDMIFHFMDENRYIRNGLNIEEAINISLAKEVEYPEQYLKNGNVTFTLKITNKGNNTAYAVPIYTYIACATGKGISHIEISGINIPGILDNMDLTDYTAVEKKTLLDIAKTQGDDHIFIKQYVKRENEDDSIFVRSNYFFVNIAPLSTMDVAITLTANEIVDVWFTAPDEWGTYSDMSNSQLVARSMRTSDINNSWFCCYKDRIECVGNVIVNGTSFVNTVVSVCPVKNQAQLAIAITDCLAQYTNKMITNIGDQFCNDDHVETEFWKKLNFAASCIDYSSLLSSCLQAFLPKKQFLEVWGQVNNIASSFGIGTATTIGNCATAFSTPILNCPPIPPNGGSSVPVNSFDPNDIYGYQAPSGSKAIKKDLEEVDYTIEFENDPEFATTAAHEVIVTDTLDRTRFDLDSFMPTSLKIGDRYVELDGEPSTISTVDMRPEVNAIAQMELDYDASKGIAKWKFTSLDPMTMERTDNPMSGFLPVNSDGNGIGEVSFRIGLLPTLDDGELVENRASIVFDQNDAIITPTWVNVVDTIAPVSTIAACEARNDSTVVLRFEATDNRSGVWRYDLYVQESTDAPWTKVAEGVEDDEYEFKGFSGFDYGFCVMATDSAGNMEAKALQREAAKPTYTAGDANGDGVVDVLDASLATDKFLGKTVYLNFEATDVNNDELIDAMDVSLIRQIFLSTVTRRSMMVRMRITTTR